MERLIVARHAESASGVRGLVNSDPDACGGLTPEGREQAVALGETLLEEVLDLVATTSFRRTQETADLALAGRSLPRLVVAQLDDIRVGRFEGGALDAYRAWAWEAGPGEAAPGGGESRAAAAARFAAGYRLLLDRPERTVLLVAHALPLRYLLDAAAGRDPGSRTDPLPYAEPEELEAAAVEAAAGRLERWSAAPAFA